MAAHGRRPGLSQRPGGRDAAGRPVATQTGGARAAAARNVGDPTGPTALVRRLSRAPRDRLELGRWGFWAHRVSGVAIFAFLILHLFDVGLYGLSRDLYDEVHALYGTAALRVFESGLLVAILFHAR